LHIELSEIETVVNFSHQELCVCVCVCERERERERQRETEGREMLVTDVANQKVFQIILVNY
jgi:hypothetical protein